MRFFGLSKLTVIVVWLIATSLVLTMLAALLPMWIAVGLSQLSMVCLVIFAARFFRGANEAVADERPWWQMTATSPWSFALGVVFLAGWCSNMIAMIDGDGGAAVIGVVHLAIAAGYFHSGYRLRG